MNYPHLGFLRQSTRRLNEVSSLDTVPHQLTLGGQVHWEQPRYRLGREALLVIHSRKLSYHSSRCMARLHSKYAAQREVPMRNK
jgi:hypothetical protein